MEIIDLFYLDYFTIFDIVKIQPRTHSTFFSFCFLASSSDDALVFAFSVLRTYLFIQQNDDYFQI